MAKVYLADDHETCRLALKLTLMFKTRHEVAGESGSGLGLADEILRTKSDVAIIDLSLPGRDGFQVFEELRRVGSKVKIILCTGHDDRETLSRAVRTGMNGFLCKGAASEMVNTAITAVMNGQQWIDPAMALPLPASQSVRQRSC